MKQYKAQPSYGLDGITKPWEPLSDEVKKGLELAAYICSMYSEGDGWAEIIMFRGEQIRALWWMEKEKQK